MQTRTQSLIEACTNVVVGYAINCCANLVVLPALGFGVSVGQACGLGLIFTVISIVRSYCLRRVFNWWHR